MSDDSISHAPVSSALVSAILVDDVQTSLVPTWLRALKIMRVSLWSS